MIIELKEITIRDVVKGYINNDESGCMAYSKKLNIRPAYQREFVYKEKQKNAVIETVKHSRWICTRHSSARLEHRIS